MATESSPRIPASTLVLVENGDLRDTVMDSLAEGGFAPTSVLRLHTLERMLTGRHPLRPDLIVLDLGCGRPSDLEPIFTLLASPILTGVPALLLTAKGVERLSRLPDLGPLVRYVAMPFAVSTLGATAWALIQRSRIACAPRSA